MEWKRIANSVGDSLIVGVLAIFFMMIPVTFLITFALAAVVITHINHDAVFPSIWYHIPEIIKFMFILLALGILIKIIIWVHERKSIFKKQVS